MNWYIPAKTFLLGEYAALAGESALVLTTSPCFKLSLTNTSGLEGIHPDSPAGIWWQKQGHPAFGLIWEDPYQGLGGLGASSAQFVGVYKASLHLTGGSFSREDMLEAYFASAWQGVGLRPSGYDVLAQSFGEGCVSINRTHNSLQHVSWPFHDLGILLLHTGVKLATHEYLQNISLPGTVKALTHWAERGRTALKKAREAELIQAVQAFQEELIKANLVAPGTLQHLREFAADADILAAKGCGAMGSDIILLLMKKHRLPGKKQQLQSLGWNVVGEVLAVNP